MDVRNPRRLHQAQEEEKYLCRMKKHMPEKFRDMCNMHLAFILNLSGDKLEAILDEAGNGYGGGSAGVKRKISIAPIFKKKVKTGTGLFGSPLVNERVCLMTPLIKFLSQKDNISKEGLFRKPGNRQRMRILRDALVAKGPSVVIDTTVYNAYDVAGVLKEFLRDLPEPLLSARHMEAHRQINDLGKHARSSEDQARALTKKMSALQLLMQLLPAPFCRLTKEMLALLHQVSRTPVTRMTPATLATIFAPIFFLDRKVSALEVCDAVKEAEPALTFIIENAEKMFQVPRELAVDVINYWKEMEATSNENKACNTNGRLSQSYKIRKSISGRTLNTAVCYLDREQCKSVDVASHTQAELENLFAHVQSLPDTPGNQRIKDLMARRSSRTPLSSGKARHSRSKSIGASIRKLVPSLSKSKAKSLDMSVQSHATPYSNKGLRLRSHSQTLTHNQVMVVDCYSPLVVGGRRQLKGNSKHSMSNAAVLSHVLMKSPAVTVTPMTATISQSIALHTTPVYRSSYYSPTLSPLDTAHSPLDTAHSPANTTHSTLDSTRSSPANATPSSLNTTHSPVNTTHSPLNTTIPTEMETPVTSRKRVFKAENQCPFRHCTPPKQECRNSNISSFAVSPCDKSHTEASLLSDSLSSGTESQYSQDNSNSSSDTVMLDSPVIPVNVTPVKRRHLNPSAKLKRSLRSTSLPASVLMAATPIEIKEELTNSSKVTAVESENEISYMPVAHGNGKNSSMKSTSNCGGESPLSSPLSRRPLRPCNVPGTPVMPRAVLSIPRYTFETSL